MRAIEARVSRRQGPQTAPANPLSQRPVLRPLAHLAALAAIIAAFLAPASAWGAAGDPPGGWQASYYPNRSLQGAPVLTRSDPAIDFDWGAGAPGPGLPADDFSVRWTADVPFATSCRGVRLVSNDGMRVSVAGREVLSFWFDQFPSERVTSLCPGPGTHSVPWSTTRAPAPARALFQLEAQAPPPGATATRAPTFTPSPAPTVSPPAGPGGLNGQYFSGRGLGSPVLTRSDPAIDFDWGAGAPGPGLPADDFSVRWTGEVLAETAGPYTFTVTSNDGARLWVAGQPLVDVWTDGVHDSSGTVQLDAGRWYPLTLEYFEGLGTARVRLAYTPPGGPPQTVPSARLRGTAAPPGPGSPTATRTPTAAPTAAPTQAPPPTATAAGPAGAPTGAPTLLSRHEIRGPLPEARNLVYRPRQFGAGLAVDDASWGDQRVDNPGPYAGWDVLAIRTRGSPASPTAPTGSSWASTAPPAWPSSGAAARYPPAGSAAGSRGRTWWSTAPRCLPTPAAWGPARSSWGASTTPAPSPGPTPPAIPTGCSSPRRTAGPPPPRPCPPAGRPLAPTRPAPPGCTTSTAPPARTTGATPPGTPRSTPSTGATSATTTAPIRPASRPPTAPSTATPRPPPGRTSPTPDSRATSSTTAGAGAGCSASTSAPPASTAPASASTTSAWRWPPPAAGRCWPICTSWATSARRWPTPTGSP